MDRAKPDFSDSELVEAFGLGLTLSGRAADQVITFAAAERRGRGSLREMRRARFMRRHDPRSQIDPLDVLSKLSAKLSAAEAKAMADQPENRP